MFGGWLYSVSVEITRKLHGYRHEPDEPAPNA